MRSNLGSSRAWATEIAYAHPDCVAGFVGRHGSVDYALANVAGLDGSIYEQLKGTYTASGHALAMNPSVPSEFCGDTSELRHLRNQASQFWYGHKTPILPIAAGKMLVTAQARAVYSAARSSPAVARALAMNPSTDPTLVRDSVVVTYGCTDAPMYRSFLRRSGWGRTLDDWALGCLRRHGAAKWRSTTCATLPSFVTIQEGPHAATGPVRPWGPINATLGDDPDAWLIFWAVLDDNGDAMALAEAAAAVAH